MTEAVPDLARRRSRVLAAGAAVTLACAAIGSVMNLFGWQAGMATWPALSGLSLLGLALLAERARRPVLVFVLVLPVLALGALALGGVLGGRRLDAGLLPASWSSLPGNSAAGLTALALALLLGVYAARRVALQVAAALCAALAVALGTFGLLGRLFGITPGIGWDAVSSVSVVTGAGLVLGGAALLLLRALDRERDGAPRGGLLPALFVLALALGVTALAWRASAQAHGAVLRERFAHQSQQLASALQQRLHGYFDLLRGAQGLYAASDEVDAEEWRRYWAQVDLPANYPGIAGTGFAPRVEARQRGDYEGTTAARLRPGLRIWPEGERAVYYPVTFLEPSRDGNLWLAGFDLASDPVRREALERAVARGEIGLSGRVDVAAREAGEVEPGFAVYVPLHAGRHDTGTAAPLFGVAYFEVRAREWLQPTGAQWRRGLHTRLFAGGRDDPAALLHEEGEGAVAGALDAVLPLQFGGQRWNLVVQATPVFYAANRSRAPLGVLLAGLSCSLLLFATTWLLGGARARAERLVARRTAELLRSQTAFQSLTDTANDAIIVADAAGRIRYLNPAAERCFDYGARELLGQSLTVLMPERFRAAHEAGMARVLGGGEPRLLGRTMELVGLRHDGSEFPLEISIAHWQAGDERQFTAILRDITRRHETDRMLQQQRRELERSNADLEQFAYVASHDLQEPLRMVASYVQLLARRYKGKLDQDADDFIGFAVDGALRMQRLIDDLLAYSRIATRAGVQREVPAADCVAAALRHLAARIAESGAQLQIGELPAVRMDPSQLTQLFQNLIGNALKFCGDAPPRVEIGAGRDAEFWRFHVRDHGIGLDPQYADRIFVIFQRLHTRQQYAGTGIGLAICKKIVERAGGRIWVESQPAAGATFFFTLPATEPVA